MLRKGRLIIAQQEVEEVKPSSAFLMVASVANFILKSNFNIFEIFLRILKLLFKFIRCVIIYYHFFSFLKIWAYLLLLFITINN